MTWVRAHRWIVGGSVGGLAFVLLALAATAYGYDRSRSDTVAEGIQVGSVKIGGLDADAARARLKHVFRPLRKPLVVRYPEGRIVLTPRQTRVTVNIRAMVARALDRSREGWFVGRAWRDLTGGKVKVRLRPTIRYSRWRVRHVIRELQDRLDRQPRNAHVAPTYNNVAVRRGRYGRAVRTELLRRRIRQALVSRHASREITVPTEILRPKVTVGRLRRKFPAYITIDRGGFTLRVFERLKLAKSYPIAVGQAGLETPAGVYYVQDKQVDPWWHVPNSAWAGSLAGQVIPPGPQDPLKARWMGLFNGAGIHGTDQTWSIGHAVSHGCVRMLIPDVIDLYDRVEVGTPVYIGN